MDVVKQEGSKFFKLTSIRGIGRIIKAKGKGFKLLWTTAVLGFGILCVFFTSRLIHQYISYPKTSKVYTVSYKQEEGKQILKDIKPAITLCNSNALSSQAEYSDNVTTWEEFSARVRKVNVTPEHLFAVAGMENYFHYIGLENAKGLGHKQEDFIVDCQIYVHDAIAVVWPEKCSEHHEISIGYLPVPQFFNCYSINIEDFTLGGDKNKSYFARSVGLVLYADNFGKHTTSDPFYDFFLPMDGIKIYLHQQNTLIPLSKDVTVYPGQNLNIDVSFTVLEQLSSPYGDCEDTPPEMLAKTLHGEQLQYSKWGCQATELQRDTFSACNCVYPIIPLVHTSAFASSETLGNCYDVDDYPTKLHCGEEHESFNCPDICKEVFYYPFLSSSPWSNIRHVDSFYERYVAGRSFESNFKAILQDKSPKDASSEIKQKLHKKIQQNFVLVKINFDTELISVNKEVAQYTFTSFISNLGGLLNLWSGVSFIVAIELIDFTVKILLRCFKSRKGSRKNLAQGGED